MYKLKMLLPFLLLLCGTYIACNKDDIVTYRQGTTVTFAGRILDENGLSLVGAEVRAGDEVTFTDGNGVFRLKPVLVDARNAILQVRKIGYFEFSRAYMVQDQALQSLTLQLLKKVQVGSVNGASGGSINVPGGATLSFPVNAVASKTGSTYSGDVRVFAHYLDPTSTNLGYNMPGDLRGINTAGKEQILSTYGMIVVEIEDQSGQALQIANGSEVAIRMPIISSQVAEVPTEIPLWYYDIEKARWMEEGLAQKSGNEYVGMVKHFSYWNCDFPYEVVNLTGKVYLGDLQHPLVGQQVLVSVASNGGGWGCGHGTTDESGCFTGGVPKDQPLELKVFISGQCNGDPVYVQAIGPFSSDATLGNIIISAPNFQTLTISGRLVDCTGQAVENGYAKVDWAGSTQIVFSDTNGDYDLSFGSCVSNAIVGSITGYDIVNLLESEAQTFNTPPNAITLDDISVCSALTEYIQYTLDGQLFTNVNVYASTSPDSLPVISYYLTSIYSFDTSQLNINLWFEHNNELGTFPLSSLYVNNIDVDNSNSSLNITVTTIAANVGDPIIGSFGGNFFDLQGLSHTITGVYRVIRRQ